MKTFGFTFSDYIFNNLILIKFLIPMRKSMIEIGCNTEEDADYFGELIRLDPVEKDLKMDAKLKTEAKKTSYENVLAHSYRGKY